VLPVSHTTVFKTSQHADAETLDAYHDYFTRVFLNSPLRDSSLPSLVYEDGDSIVGFLGVVPRRMMMEGGPFRRPSVLNSSSILPRARSRRDAARADVLRRSPVASRSQMKANDIARKIWEGLGGMTVLLRSLHWTRPLRPATLAVSTLQTRRTSRRGAFSRPVARMVDAIANTPRAQSFPPGQGRGITCGDADEQAVLDFISELDASGSLHVDYDERTLRWVLEQARAVAGQVARCWRRRQTSRQHDRVVLLSSRFRSRRQRSAFRRDTRARR
jgi:hypothetical protein